MSRTFRRNKPHLIEDWVGSFDEFLKNEFLWRYLRWNNDTDEFFTEAVQEMLLREYLKKLVNYTRDNRRGQYGVPRWFRNWYAREERRLQREEIRRCIRSDEWDDHLNLEQPNQAKWYWF